MRGYDEMCTHGMQGTVAFQEACTVKNFKTMRLLAALGARTNALVGGMFHSRPMYTTCTAVFVAGTCMHLRMCCNLALHPALLAFVTCTGNVSSCLGPHHSHCVALSHAAGLYSAISRWLLAATRSAVGLLVAAHASCSRRGSRALGHDRCMRPLFLYDAHVRTFVARYWAHQRLRCSPTAVCGAAAARCAALRQAMRAHPHATPPAAVHLVCHHGQDLHAGLCVRDIGDGPRGGHVARRVTYARPFLQSLLPTTESVVW